jgi:hypothetical protein
MYARNFRKTFTVNMPDEDQTIVTTARRSIDREVKNHGDAF